MEPSSKSFEIDQFICENDALRTLRKQSVVAGKRSPSDYFLPIFAVSLAIGVCVYFGATGELSGGAAISIGSVALAIMIYVRRESELITKQITELKSFLEQSE